MEEKKFSIIMAVYNKELYVEKAIESVLNQSYKNFELIIVNDGSQDNSIKICKRYAKRDRRIIILEQNNLGVSSARNLGINHSSGEYIIFLDADDYLENRCIEKFIQEVDINNDVYICSFRRIYKNWDEIVFNRFEKLKPLIKGTGQNVLKKMYDENIDEASVWANIYKREYIVKNNIYFFEGIIHEDEEWLIRVMLLASRVQVVDCLLYNTLAGVANSIINSNNYKKSLSKIIISDNILKFMNNINFEDDKLKKRLKLAMTSFYINSISQTESFTAKEREEILNLAKSKKYILKNASSNKQILAGILLFFLGFKFGSKILNKISKIR